MFSSYLRNFIFGVEDSLVSTVGLLSGVAVGGLSRREIMLTGIVLIFVEAFSMAVGAVISENSAREYEKRREVPLRFSSANGFIMFSAYFLSGFIPLAPYAIVKNAWSLPFSIILSLAALFILGMLSGSLSRLKIFRHGIKMSLVGGTAILVGVIVGRFVSGF